MPRKMLTDASYFAFTATPKNKTLEMFGGAFKGPESKVKHLPFHSYTMKQAIQEGFILDRAKGGSRSGLSECKEKWPIHVIWEGFSGFAPES